MNRTALATACLLAMSSVACEEAGGERVPFDVQVSSLDGSDVGSVDVRTFDTLNAWIAGSSPVDVVATDADGIAVVDLVDGEDVWIDVRVGPYETNWGGTIIYRPGGDPIVVETQVDPTSAMTGKTWEVVTAEADTAAGGAPTQEELDCWVGATFTFVRSNGRKGRASASASDGCTAIDFSAYNEWSDRDGTDIEVREAGNTDRYPLTWRLGYLEGSVATTTAWGPDSVAPAESSVSITLEPVD